MKNWNWRTIGIVIGVLAASMLHPVGRQIIKFILPLGSGWDDFVAIALMIAFIIWAVARGWIKWSKTKDFLFVDNNKNYRVKQAVLAVLCAIALLAVPNTGQAINNALLFGKYNQLTTPDFLIPAAIIAVILVVGWNLFSYFHKRSKKK